MNSVDPALDVQLAPTDLEPCDWDCDVLVVGVDTGANTGVGFGTRSARILEPAASAAALLGLDAGRPVPVTLSPPGVTAPFVALVAVDPGHADGRGDETARWADPAAAALRHLDRFGRIGLALPTDTLPQLGAVVRGAHLGAHLGARRRGTRSAPVQTILLRAPSTGRGEAAARDVVTRATVVASAVVGARDLVNQPPDALTPVAFAGVTERLAEQHGLRVEVWDHDRIRAEGLGGLNGVGQGSAHPPCLAILRYEPPDPSRRVALVGKGITFDSGGVNLKSTDELATMKADMAGAAAVLHATLASARLASRTAVTAWLPLAENAVSGSAIRPGDVLTLHDGTTVEVRNTDLEGRLILADALILARSEHPDVIIDVATLTDAQAIALGTRTSALIANDDTLAEGLLDSARSTGEGLWQMPLPTYLREALTSDVADLANQGESLGTMLTAAAFLQEFASPQADPVAWAHLDICGTAYNTGAAYSVVPSGGTGVAVQTLTHFLT